MKRPFFAGFILLATLATLLGFSESTRANPMCAVTSATLDSVAFGLFGPDAWYMDGSFDRSATSSASVETGLPNRESVTHCDPITGEIYGCGIESVSLAAKPAYDSFANANRRENGIGAESGARINRFECDFTGSNWSTKNHGTESEYMGLGVHSTKRNGTRPQQESEYDWENETKAGWFAILQASFESSMNWLEEAKNLIPEMPDMREVALSEQPTPTEALFFEEPILDETAFFQEREVTSERVLLATPRALISAIGSIPSVVLSSENLANEAIRSVRLAMESAPLPSVRTQRVYGPELPVVAFNSREPWFGYVDYLDPPLHPSRFGKFAREKQPPTALLRTVANSLHDVADLLKVAATRLDRIATDQLARSRIHDAPR